MERVVCLRSFVGTCLKRVWNCWETVLELFGIWFGTYGEQFWNFWVTFGELLWNLWGTAGDLLGNFSGAFSELYPHFFVICSDNSKNTQTGYYFFWAALSLQ